jgi:hypothetical protein
MWQALAKRAQETANKVQQLRQGLREHNSVLRAQAYCGQFLRCGFSQGAMQSTQSVP